MNTKFLDFYKSASKSAYEKIAFNTFVNDLLRDKKTGSAKSRTVTALDMESKTPIRFIPSLFYTFLYITPKMQSLDKKDGFIDAVPLIFCTSNLGNKVAGINFNMIPTDVRAAVIDTIVNTDEEFYKSASGEYQINEKLAKVLISKPSIFLSVIQDTTGYDISSAFRQYNTEYIQNVRMIEYDQWEYIPFLVFKDDIRGINLASMQKEMAVNNHR